MVKRLVGTSALLVIAIVAPASAQQPNSSNETIVVTGPQFDNKVVCRFEQNTGTRFQTRICHTNKQWDKLREQQLRDAREMVDQVIAPVTNSKRD
jgi:hypothetical protein